MIKTLLAFALLTLSLSQTQPEIQNRSGLEVLSVDVKEKVTRESWDPSIVSQQPPVIRPNPSANRGTDRNEPPILTIQRDTNQRMSDLHSLEDTKGQLPSRSRIVLNYESQAQMKNDTAKSITRFVWAYRASPELRYTQDQEFFCNVKIEPSETKRVKVTSPYPRQKVVNVSAASTNPIAKKPALKDVIINQIQFADGVVWERPNWNGTFLLRRAKAQNLGKGKCIAL